MGTGLVAARSGWLQIFENLYVCFRVSPAQLLKYCHFIEDTEGVPMELRYLRDHDRREVDFVVTRKGKPQFAVECKASERSADPALFYFAERTGIPKFFQVHLGEAHFQRGNVTLLPFRTLCQELGLP